MLNRKCSIR